MMSISVTTTGPGIPRKPWDTKASRQLGEHMVGVFVARIHTRGQDVDDRAFKPFSTRPTSISLVRGVGLRLVPKGGRLSASGRSMFFSGGYREYHQLSRGSTKKVLIASGQLLRSWRVKLVRADKIRIGIDGRPAVYGLKIDASHHYIGVSPRDRAEMRKAVTLNMRRAMDRSRTK